MADRQLFPPSQAWRERALVDADGYTAMYEAARRDPEAFWGEQGRRLDWIQPYSQVKDCSFDEADFRIRWYTDGQLNVAYNCIDRHLAERGDAPAILWEGDD